MPTKNNLIPDPANRPLYKGADVARFVAAPVPTIRRWFFGGPGNSASLVPANLDDHSLSFVNLVEAHVLLALRWHYRFSLQEIRKTVLYLKHDLKTDHPLVDPRIKTDRVRIYVDRDSHLVDATGQGQMAIRDVIGPHLERIEWDRHGTLVRLWPITRPVDSLAPQPRVVTIDPRVGLGRPTIATTGIRTAIINQRFRGGDSLEALARDYGRTIGEIEEAIRFETRAA